MTSLRSASSTAEPSSSQQNPSPRRIRSIDALRGLAMIIMALDHVREFFHSGAMNFQPEDLTRTTTVLFLTRWITHICAPVFFFTAGVGAFLWLRGGRTPAQLSSFLWKRGLWLILLDLVVVRLALNFSLFSGMLIPNVLWALGWCMVVLAVAVRIPLRWLAPHSVAVMVLHNLLDSVPAQRFGSAAPLWNILHAQGIFNVHGVPVLVAYPLVPWIAVMAAGYCFGCVFDSAAQDRRRWMLQLGAALVLTFLVLRFTNIYGDPRPWSQAVPGMTVLSFLRCTKYPPSLDFLLMTLGPALMLLAWFDRLRWKPTNPLVVFGRVPLFYFVVHLYLAHALAIPLAFLRYGRASFLFGPAPSMGGALESYPTGYGYPLWMVYVLWAAVVVVLYPLCRYFAAVKQRSGGRWVSYF